MLPKSKEQSLINTKGLIFILLIMLTLTVGGLYALLLRDDQKFSGPAALFPAELNSLISSDTKKNEEAFLKKFTAFWLSDSIDIDTKDKIIANANKILGLLPNDKSPIINYVKLISTFYHNAYAQKQYPVWNEFFTKHLDSSSLNFDRVNRVIRQTHALIDSSIIATSSSHTWRVYPHNSYVLKNGKGLTVSFSNVRLTCLNYKKDSTYIQQTSGNLNFLKQEWVGRSGRVTWFRSEYNESKIYAILSNYTINLHRNEYSADSVLLYLNEYFKVPLLGKLTDKVSQIYPSIPIKYPEFIPYQKNFEITNLFPNIDYTGNIKINGSQISGIGTDGELATVSIKRNGIPFLNVEGKLVLIEQSKLISDRAKITIYFGNDSIYHNGLAFTYAHPNKTISINTTDKLTTQSPFYSSYHKTYIWASEMTWNIEKDEIAFGAISSSISNADFESENFFNPDLFDNMMGASSYHPVLTIWNYTRKIKSNTFKATDLAVYVRRAPEDVKIEMMRMAKLGYVLYNFETDEVSITQKLRYNVLARIGRTDFDVIKFFSNTEGFKPNATLNLNNLNLTINGVERLSVSDSQNVFISPYRKTIILQKNRDFIFGGKLRAGLFNFYGNEFKFDYENYKIILNNVDSLKIDYLTDYRDNYGMRLTQSVANALHIISGEILIDKPHNKSGREFNPQYPTFNCTSKSYVYYDATNIHGGVYKRDSFYFEIQPFVYENMDNFEKADMKFKGILYSGNILAPIEDTLSIRPDNSLGFITTTPPEGMAVYKGKGMVYNKIDLSNQGLIVNGSIGYITSTTESDKMLLFPDSMVTKSQKFTLAKRETGIEFPNLKGGSHKIKWLPNDDKMFIAKGEKPFVMYDSLATHNGDLLLQPLGLTGSGQMNIPNGRLQSILFEYTANSFGTPKTSLLVFKPNTDTVVLSTELAKAKVNFANMQGEFTRVDKSIFANLDALRYASFHDRFKWDLNNNNIYFETLMQQEDVALGKFRLSNMVDRDSLPLGSLFYSTLPTEDSLYFFSPKASYNTTKIMLNADSVKYIITADATVFPHKKKVQVDTKNRMHKLKEAVISANNTTAYHKLYNAEIKINGRKNYSGSAYYDYIDERDSIQAIYFPKVYSDNNMNTYAEGTLTEPDSFKLSPNFAFLGNVSLSAPEKLLYFMGGAKPLYDCPNPVGQWVKFESQIDPQKVLIPISDSPRDINLYRITSGTLISEDSLKLYGGFLRSRKFWSDSALVTAWGYMNFNNNNRRFTIAPLYKLENPDTSGNSVSLQKDYCWVFGEGNVRLPINLNELKFKIYASIIHKLEPNEAAIDAIIQLNFLFNPKALEAMANQLVGAITLEKIDPNRKLYRKMLYDWVQPKELPAALNQLSLFGAFTQTPKGLESTITLSDVKLHWNPQSNSFVSIGKIGIGSIGNVQINRYVNGFIEFYKGRNSNRMILYIHLGDNEYYSFYYATKTMQANSHNPDFFNPIAKQPSREQRLKTRYGFTTYRFLLGSNREINIAKKRYKELSYGINSDASENIEKDNKDETKDD